MMPTLHLCILVFPTEGFVCVCVFGEVVFYLVWFSLVLLTLKLIIHCVFLTCWDYRCVAPWPAPSPHHAASLATWPASLSLGMGSSWSYHHLAAALAIALSHLIDGCLCIFPECISWQSGPVVTVSSVLGRVARGPSMAPVRHRSNSCFTHS